MTGMLSALQERYAKAQLERDLRALVTASPSRQGLGGRRVGIASLASGDWHLVLEQLLGHALIRRGVHVELLVCDLPERPICEERTAFSHSRDRCAGCLDAKRGLLEAGGIRWTGLSRFVASGAMQAARAAVAPLDAKALEDFSHSGWPLSAWSHVSACHFLRSNARGNSVDALDARRRLIATGIVLVDAISGWLDTFRPEIVLVESGAHLEWRIARELAGARGIPVYSREMGKGGWDRHMYALNRDAMSPDLDAAWRIAATSPLSPAEARAVDEGLDGLAAATFVPRHPTRRREPRALRDELVPRTAQRVAVAFTNVTWDLATAGRDVAFDGVTDWLHATVAALAPHRDSHLIVRAHPAEASVLTSQRVGRDWPGAAPQVTVVPAEDGLAASDLIAMAELVLAYNSTAALEAAARGAAVLLCGAAHFRDRGFSIDISSREQYAQLLGEWACGRVIEPPGESSELARRYFHLFFSRYQLSMGWTTSPLEAPYQLTLATLDELDPGRNANLDAVCGAVLEGRQVLLPRQAEDAVSTL